MEQDQEDKDRSVGKEEVKEDRDKSVDKEETATAMYRYRPYQQDNVNVLAVVTNKPINQEPLVPRTIALNVERP